MKVKLAAELYKMKTSIFLLFILALAGCKKEEIFIPDLCPGCTCEVNLNGDPWQCDPHSSGITTYSQEPDTFFYIAIYELEPQNDIFKDVLMIYHIPYATGVYVLDSLEQLKPKSVYPKFNIYEVARDVPAQTYRVIPGGSNFINVEHLNKSTKYFEVSFHFNMSASHTDWHFITYPHTITFANGRVKGTMK